MSRKVVIGVIIIIVISIIAAIAVFIFSSLNQQQSQQYSSTSNTQLAINSSNAPTVDPLADPDQDGLTNAQESLWGTNPNNPDTDGDGYKDGAEVAACHNPVIPAPNDKLVHCTPGNQAITSPSSTLSPQTADPFFTKEPESIGGTLNLTQAYVSAVKDSNKSPVTFSQFIANQPIITDLPQVNDAAIKKGPDSAADVSQYMNIAGDLSSISDKARLTIALNDFFKYRNTYGFTTLAEAVDAFQSRVKLLSVPNSAQSYDKMLLAYTELLSATFRQIADFPDDQVKAMVAIRQLDAIDRQYYPQLVQQRDQLLAPVQ
ncbi:MAG TPA: hypothetical protein VLG69_01330 [Candidatus Andersenbacteria bacterium]|nr:hypothetical protein [Candidatus Andersenbacteria bacterium]